MSGDDQVLKELVAKFKDYIRGHHNASAWWNDPSAWDWMKWLEEFERKHFGQATKS